MYKCFGIFSESFLVFDFAMFPLGNDVFKTDPGGGSRSKSPQCTVWQRIIFYAYLASIASLNCSASSFLSAFIFLNAKAIVRLSILVTTF